jgi:hypothetical protein
MNDIHYRWNDGLNSVQVKPGGYTNGAMTFSTSTLSIVDLIAKLCRFILSITSFKCHYKEDRNLFTMLNVIQLSVIMLNVVIVSVFMKSAAMLSVIVLSVVILSVNMLENIVPSVVILSVDMLRDVVPSIVMLCCYAECCGPYKHKILCLLNAIACLNKTISLFFVNQF